MVVLFAELFGFALYAAVKTLHMRENIEFLLQSHCLALALVLGYFCDFISPSLKIDFSELQKTKYSVSEGGGHAWEDNSKHLLCFSVLEITCEISRYTNPCSSAAQ